MRWGKSSGLSKAIADADIPVKDSADSPAVILDISKRAKQAAVDTLKFKSKEENDGSLNINENDFSEESAEKLQQQALEIMSRPTDPFTYEDQMRTMICCFGDNTPESTINSILGGRAINSSVVTSELSKMLRQTITNKDASVSERAENRESALKCAQYIADKYVDDPGKAKEFMSAIDDIYKEDVYEDKGYFEIEPGEWVREGSVKAGDKLLPPDYTGLAFTRAYCKAHGFRSLVGLNETEMSEYFDAWCDFSYNSSPKTIEKMEAEGRKASVQNENNVTSAIKNAKPNFNYSLFNSNIARLLKAF